MKTLKILFVSLLLTAGCVATGQKTTGDNYPDIWWKEVPKDQLAGWEIPPQAADRSKGEVILSKRNELGKLSNFHPAPFELDGIRYASIEGLWQSMKYPENAEDERNRDKDVVWPHTRAQVEGMSAFEAKKAGSAASANMKKLGIKWITYKGEKLYSSGPDTKRHYEIIESATRAKLAANPDIKELLLRTGNLKLLPDHVQPAGMPPAYQYFDIYMKLRAEIQNEK
jgi:predicted NAD-dependent protein-ADP-ribosyltransferase YbiA (DUF1768 family)